jgi:hypothetical protein
VRTVNWHLVTSGFAVRYRQPPPGCRLPTEGLCPQTPEHFPLWTNGMIAERCGVAGPLPTTNNRFDSTCLSGALHLQYNYGFADYWVLRDGENAMVDTLWLAICDFTQWQGPSTKMYLPRFGTTPAGRASPTGGETDVAQPSDGCGIQAYRRGRRGREGRRSQVLAVPQPPSLLYRLLTTEYCSLPLLFLFSAEIIIDRETPLIKLQRSGWQFLYAGRIS